MKHSAGASKSFSPKSPKRYTKNIPAR